MQNSNMTTKKNKVVLGLSGGVDSTAAALLLQREGYSVTGLFLDTLGNQKDLSLKAEKAANQLGIEFIYHDVSQEFDDQIIHYFCETYAQGRTPNPCVRCNPKIKFRALAEIADRIGCEYIATGHYATVDYDSKEEAFFISRGTCLKKDQSYMLYRLDQAILKRLILPLGRMESKEQVRGLVKEAGMSNAETKDSQEICFIKDNSYVDFLLNRGYELVPGDFVDTTGAVIGTHKGLLCYTVGQRKGLGSTFGKPAFVSEIQADSNRVVLSRDEDLFQSVIHAEDAFFTGSKGESNKMPASYSARGIQAKVRYAAPLAEALLQQNEDGSIMIQFKKPQRAPAPGQSVAFYSGDRVLGGAIIT